jgi:hypothetical protein
MMITRRKSIKSVLAFASFPRLFALAVLTLCLAIFANAQGYGTIDAGTTITVRTNETINAKDSDGRVYSGAVSEDVRNNRGNIIVPKGSNVEMVVKKTSDNEVALDLAAIVVNSQRYGVESEDSVVSSEQKEGIGANKRTGKYVGGGALLGAVIGAVAGGKKGAAIGAGVGAAAGAGTQVLTRGKSVNVPAESLLTFRLEQPLRTRASNTGSTRDGRYPSVSQNNSAAYREGLQAGRSDANRSLQRNTRSSRWTSVQDKRDYEAGYNAGYDSGRNSGTASHSRSSLHIANDNNVSWQAPANARVYVQVDDNPTQLFAEGPSGTQAAPWINSGHVYLFILRDMSGNELARDRLDTRQPRDSYRSKPNR